VYSNRDHNLKLNPERLIDADARIMGKNGCFDYAYNAQISVDADSLLFMS